MPPGRGKLVFSRHSRGELLDAQALMNAPTLDEALAECLSIMENLRDYVVKTESYGVQHFPDPMQRLAAIRESSRLTGRLTSVLSWLLWHKAALNGEIDRSELNKNAAEVMEDAPKAASDSDLAALPDELKDLLNRSEQLFVRISRLQSQAGE